MIRSPWLQTCPHGICPKQAWTRGKTLVHALRTLSTKKPVPTATTVLNPGSRSTFSDIPFPTGTSAQHLQHDTPVQQSADAAVTKSSQPRIATLKILPNPRNNAPWTLDDDSRLVALRSQGLTWGSIASILSRHRTACSRRYDQISTVGSPHEPSHHDTTNILEPMSINHPETRERLFNLVDQGVSWKKIGEEFGVKAYVCQIQWQRLRRQMSHSPIKSTTSKRQPPARSLDDGQTHSLSTSTFRSLKSFTSTLAQAVQEHGVDQWETISQQVFGGMFSPGWLRHQYRRHEQEKGKWSKQEERQLADAVQAVFESSAVDQGGDLTPSQWETIASQHGDRRRTAEECGRRWRSFQLAQVSEGRRHKDLPEILDANKTVAEDKYVTWTDEASAKLVSLIPSCSKYERGKRLIDWLKVEEVMKPFGYTKSQCKAKWNRMIKICDLTSPLQAVLTIPPVRIMNKPWEQQEIEALLHGVANLGDGAWMRIQKEHLPGRLAKGIQGKWNGIMHKLLRESYVNLTSIEHEAERLYGPVVRRDLEQISSKWPRLISKARERLRLGVSQK